MPITGYPGWVDKLRNSEGVYGTIEAYNAVPMLYRCVNLRADALSSVPYSLYRKGEEVQWPWKQHLPQLIKETERSLLLTGAAYWLKLYRGRVLTGFQFLNPTTMSVHFDETKARPGNPWAGVTFIQTIHGKQYGPWTIDDVVYFREPSLTDEIGPGIPPARVALQSAQLGHYLERFVSVFFENGAQPVTIMNLPENMDDNEYKRFTTETNSRFSGVINAFRWLFVRSQDLKVTTLTPPIESLMLPELQERAVTQVAMTLGVPRTMLEASAANYATADSDRQSFWRETVIPRLSLYQQVLNELLFHPLQYELYFNPEALDVMQADEAQRAGSLLQLVQAGVPLRGAMKILGYDGIEEALGPEEEELPVPELPEQPPEEPPPPPPTDETVEGDTSETVDEEDVELKKVRDTEWSLLQKKIERRIKAGKSPECAFDGKAISQDEVKSVMARLSDETRVNDLHDIIHEVKAIGDLTPIERALYDRIVAEMDKRGKQWARQIVAGKEVIPTLVDVIAPALQVQLGTYMRKELDRLGKEFVPFDDAVLTGRVDDWLSDYVPVTTSKIDETSAERVRQVINTYRQTPGMTIDDVTELLRPTFDGSRAAMIAVTEMTRASTQAVNNYQEYLTENGIETTMYWSTQNDEIVDECPVCSPLHNVPRDEWPDYLQDGPPAHPRCRCTTYITTRKVKR
jgi:HK97 family phage portal protein